MKSSHHAILTGARRLWASERTAAQLIRSGFAGAAMQVTNKLLALATSVLLARLLGVEGYGVYAFAIALTGMVSTLVEMGMSPLTLRETAKAIEPSDRTKVIGTHLRAAFTLMGAVGLLLGLLGLFVLLFAPLAMTTVERDTLLLAIPLILLAPFTRTGAAVLAGLRRLVASQAFEQLVTPLLVAVGILLLSFAPRNWATPEMAMIVQLLSGAIAVLTLAFVLRSFFSQASREPRKPIELAYRGWPFLMIGSALVINQQLDTVLVGLVLGTADVAPYRVATQGAQLAMFGSFVINTIISPFIARYHAQGDHAALRKLFSYARWATALTVGLALAIFVIAGRPLIAVLFGDDFVDAAPLLVILTIGYLGNAIAGPCGTVLAMTGLERYSARALWVSAGVNGVCAVAAGYAYGVYGVAVVTAATVALYQGWLRYIQWRELAV